jgi:D-alanine transaminase
MIINNNWTYYKGERAPQGLYLTKDKVCISPNDRGFMFADGVYEVIRTYKGKFFHLPEHLKRLQRSLDAVSINYRSMTKIESVVRELLKRNNLQKKDASIYIQITRGVWFRSHAFPTEPVLPTVYIEASPFIPHEYDAKKGVAAITASDIRWGRCDIKSVGLLANVLARQRAVDNKAVEAIFIRDGVIIEGTHSNVFGVKDGMVMTHPKTNHILAGITRDTVIDLCAKLRIPLTETCIPECRIFELDELFLAGTTVEVMPVVKVNGKPIAKGHPGKITKALQKAFRNHVLAASR